MSTANLDAADLKGNSPGNLIREDVMSKIWDISKIPLPFTDLVGGGSAAKQEFIEWTTDELSAPDLTNAVIDGSDPSDNNTKLGARVGNHHQISDKVVRVSHRADVSDTIGRAKELGYQVMRRQQELRRDVEAICLYPQASVQDNGNNVAGKVGTFPSWLTTNTVNVATAGGYDSATKLTVSPIADAPAALAESDVRDVITSIYEEGGDASVMMSVPGVIGAFALHLFSSSAQIATLMSDQGKSREQAAALSAISVFITQHGTVKLVSNRLQQEYDNPTSTGTDTADVFFIDPEYVSLCYLEGYKTFDLAKTGLANNKMMTVDWSLIVNTENAHGMIMGIDPTLAATA